MANAAIVSRVQPEMDILSTGPRADRLRLVGYALALPQVRVFGVALDVHTLLVASLAGLMGWQCVLLAALARIFAAREGMMPPHPRLETLTVERGLVFGLLFLVIGIVTHRHGDHPVVARSILVRSITR